MGTPFEGGQGPAEAAAPYMDGEPDCAENNQHKEQESRGGGGADSPFTLPYPDSSGPVTKGRNKSNKIG